MLGYDRDEIKTSELSREEKIRMLLKEYDYIYKEAGYLMFHRKEDAEDLTQITFLKAIKHVKLFNPSRSLPRTWLMIIMRRIAFDAIRLKYRRDRIIAQELMGISREEWEESREGMNGSKRSTTRPGKRRQSGRPPVFDYNFSSGPPVKVDFEITEEEIRDATTTRPDRG